MKNNRQAFTLVELIVVITILAILGTIGFIWYQWYWADARNAKRISDLNNISNLILINTAEEWAPLVFVWWNNENKLNLASIVVWWKVATNDVYKAGLPRYSVFQIKKSDFLDPNGQEYRIGATSTFWGRYELAAVLENGETPHTYIKWNYIPRLSTDVTIDSVSNNIITLPIAASNMFKARDTIETNNGGFFTIRRVARDNTTVTFDTDMTGIVSIKLALSETAWLLASKDNSSIVLENNSEINFPY